MLRHDIHHLFTFSSVSLYVKSFIQYLESSLEYSIAQNQMQLATEMIEYAKENNVTLDWNYIIQPCIFARNVEGMKFCIDKGGVDSISVSTRSVMNTVMDELLRERSDNVKFI